MPRCRSLKKTTLSLFISNGIRGHIDVWMLNNSAVRFLLENGMVCLRNRQHEIDDKAKLPIISQYMILFILPPFCHRIICGKSYTYVENLTLSPDKSIISKINFFFNTLLYSQKMHEKRNDVLEKLPIILT